MLRALAFLLFLAFLVVGGAYLIAGRGSPPVITIDQPERYVGQNGTLGLTVESPMGALSTLTVTLDQGGAQTTLFSLDAPGAATVTQVDENHVRITMPLGKTSVPSLQPGSARILVSASRPSWLELRTLSGSASHDLEVRLDPPSLSVVSTHHYINHGGAELVVFRAAPADVTSVVRVGEVEYPSFAASDAGVATSDPSLRVAFFALLHDQDLNTPISIVARDPAGNEATAMFVDQRFARRFRRSRIQLDDRFLGRVVPEILQRSPELGLPPQGGDLLPAFLRINRELRQANADRIIQITADTSPRRLWTERFVQLGNSQVEASFADHRTYIYNGEEVDQQVHLGFDLAATAQVPVTAANTGRVLYASWLGIYGNCVILDHGLGVATLYGHLSSIDVQPGQTVTRGQTLGRTGTTGLAGGDHLHFTVLLKGLPVNPVEWWDPIWTRDRVERKLTSASGAPVSTP